VSCVTYFILFAWKKGASTSPGRYFLTTPTRIAPKFGLFVRIRWDIIPYVACFGFSSFIHWKRTSGMGSLLMFPPGIRQVLNTFGSHFRSSAVEELLYAAAAYVNFCLLEANFAWLEFCSKFRKIRQSPAREIQNKIPLGKMLQHRNNPTLHLSALPMIQIQLTKFACHTWAR